MKIKMLNNRRLKMSVKYEERTISYRRMKAVSNVNRQPVFSARSIDWQNASSARIQNFADEIPIVPFNKLNGKINPSKK